MYTLESDGAAVYLEMVGENILAIATHQYPSRQGEVYVIVDAPVQITINQMDGDTIARASYTGILTVERAREIVTTRPYKLEDRVQRWLLLPDDLSL